MPDAANAEFRSRRSRVLAACGNGPRDEERTGGCRHRCGSLQSCAPQNRCAGHANLSVDTKPTGRRSAISYASRRNHVLRQGSFFSASASRPCSLWTSAQERTHRPATTASIAPQFRECTISGRNCRMTRARAGACSRERPSSWRSMSFTRSVGSRSAFGPRPRSVQTMCSKTGGPSARSGSRAHSRGRPSSDCPRHALCGSACRQLPTPSCMNRSRLSEDGLCNAPGSNAEYSRYRISSPLFPVQRSPPKARRIGRHFLTHTAIFHDRQRFLDLHRAVVRQYETALGLAHYIRDFAEVAGDQRPARCQRFV